MPRAPIDDNHHKGLVIRDELGGPALDVTGASLTNANALHVAVVDGSGNQITTFGGSGGTASTDDGAFTAGSGSGTPMMGFVTSDAVDSGDVGVVGMLANRQQKMTLYDSSGVEITSFGGGTQYTEDAAAAANPVGNALNLVRDDARGGSLTTTDGDNVAARGTNAGELYVKHVDSIPVTDNGGSLTVDGTITANLGTLNGAATSAKQDTGNTSLASIDGKITAVNTGAVTISSALPAGTNNIGDVDVLTVPTDPFGANADAASATGSISAKLRFIAGTGIPITGTVTVGSHAVTNAGTFVVQVDGAALTALQLIDDPIFADDAAYTLSTSKGQIIEGVAVETDGSDPTSVSAEGDAAAVRTDRNRRMLVNGMHPNSFVLFEDHTSAQTNNQLKTAPGANLSIYITDVIFSNGATAGSIKLVEDEGGTPVQITQTVYMAINGGAVMNFITPKRLTANKTLGFTSTTVTTHSVEIHGYVAP